MLLLMRSLFQSPKWDNYFNIVFLHHILQNVYRYKISYFIITLPVKHAKYDYYNFIYEKT